MRITRALKNRIKGAFFSFSLACLRLRVDFGLFLRRLKNKPDYQGSEGTVVVVCAAGENFAMPMAAMVSSVIKNLKRYKGVKIYILHNTGFSDKLKEKVEKGLDRKKAEINWARVDTAKIEGLKTREHITAETYYKLLIPEILPLDLDKAIYLDCDLIIEDDIGKLWDIQMSDEYLMAVPEIFSQSALASSPCGIKQYKELGISNDAKIFNGGVLIMNLKKWREDNISSRIINYLRQFEQDVIWLEQEGMNAVLAGRWRELDSRWNFQTHLLYNYHSWKESPLDKITYNRTIKKPYIVHFNTCAKPWQKENNHPYRNLFFHYLDMTAWKGWRPH